MQSIKGFADGRRRLAGNGEKMSRLYAIEGRLSLTGSMADHRLRMPSGSIVGIAMLLATKLGGNGGGNSFAAFNDPNIDAWVSAMAADLQATKGRAVVVCGSQQPAAVHGIVAAINQTLNKIESPIRRLVSYQPTLGVNDLAEQISQGAIKTLFLLGGNPAFNAPAELGFGDQLMQVDQVIRLGCHVDETSAASTTHVPTAHFLESWSDAVSYAGDYLSIQPLILPLYNGISEIELLGQLAGLPAPKGPEYVQDTFQKLAGGLQTNGATFDNAWRPVRT